MEDSLKKKIAAYITLAGAVLMKQNAEAQIVYHDILPDDSLNNFNQWEYQFLDLNNDGQFDIKFNANRDANGLDFVFVQQNTGASFYNPPLIQNDIINSSLYFTTSFGTLVYPFASSTSSTAVESGLWMATTDKYFAVKLHQGANDYYGWVRLDVNVPSSKINVKDFAVNLTPNTQILAGDKGCNVANPEMPIITQTAGDTLVSTPASTYQWYFNGSELAGETNQNLSFNQTGNYSLITTDTNNCHLQSSVFHYGNCIPSPVTINILTSDTICSGPFSHFNFPGTTSENYFYWYKNDELINLNPSYINNYYVLLDSSADVKIIITNGSTGCSDTSNIVHVELINQNFSGTLSGFPTFIGCNNNSSQLITDQIFNSATYHWYLENNNIQNSASNIFNATSSGFYHVDIVETGTGCHYTTNEFGISPATIPPAPQIWQSIDTLYTGLYFKYQWYLNGNALANDTLRKLVLSQQGNYSVEVWNEAGCSNNSIGFISSCDSMYLNIYSATPTFYCSDSVVIELNSSSVPNGFLLQWYQNSAPILSPTIDSTASFLLNNNSDFFATFYNQSNGCSDTSNVISYSINNAVSIDIQSNSPSEFCGSSAEIELNTSTIPSGYEVQWFVNNNPVSVPTTDSVFTTEIFSSSDIVGYLFNPNSDCSDTSNTISFSLYQNPSPSISQSNDTLFTGNFTSYQWYYYGSILPSDTFQYLPVSLEGNYKVTVWNQYDCSAQSIFYYYTPTNISIIGSQNDLQLVMYENFAELKFTNEKWLGAEVKLINNAGQLLSELTVKKSSEQFDISQLPKGIYFISIKNNTEILNYKISIL